MLHSHGTQDPLVPALMATTLEQDVIKPNMAVEYIAFPGAALTSPRLLLRVQAATPSPLRYSRDR